MTTSDMTKQIEKMEDARFVAVLAGDVEALDRLLHDDLVYFHSSAVSDSKASYLKGLGDGTWVYHSVDRSDQSIVSQGDVALVFNRLDMRIEAKGEEKHIDARSLAVWTRHEGDWRLIGVQSGSMPKVEA